MAYKERYKRYYRSARSAYNFKRTYRRGGFGVGISTKFLIGLAASFVPVNLPPVANTAIAAVAVAPIKLPGGIKGITQGYMMGKIVQQFTGNPLASGSNAVNTNGLY